MPFHDTQGYRERGFSSDWIIQASWIPHTLLMETSNTYKLQLKLVQGGTWLYIISGLKMAIRWSKIRYGWPDKILADRSKVEHLGEPD